MYDWSDIKEKIGDIKNFSFDDYSQSNGSENSLFFNKGKLEKIFSDLEIINNINDNNLDLLFYAKNDKENIFKYLSSILKYLDIIKPGVPEVNLRNYIDSIFSDFSYLDKNYLSRALIFNIGNNNLPEIKDYRKEIEKLNNELKELTKSHKYEKKGITKEVKDLQSLIKIEKNKFTEAENLVESFISLNERGKEIFLGLNSEEFKKKAERHEAILISATNKLFGIEFKKREFLVLKVQAPFWWLALSALMALVIMTVSYNSNFFEDIRNFLTVDDKVNFMYLKDIPYIFYFSKITFILVPISVMWFSLNQYVSNRKLHEIFINRDVVLRNMMFLLTQYKNNDNLEQEIIEKSLSVLFTDVDVKNKSGNEKMLIDILKNIKLR